MDDLWYILRVDPRQSSSVEAELRVRGYEAYAPKYVRDRKHRRYKSRRQTQGDLFPGYLFFRPIGALVGWGTIRRFGGVRGLLKACPGSAVPATLLNEEIEELKARVDAGEFDEGRSEPSRLIAVGEHLVIAGGPFEGMAGVVVDTSEARSVLEIEETGHRVGMPNTMLLNERSLEMA